VSSITRSRAAGRPAARLREGRRQGADGKSPRHAAVHVGLEERLGGVRAGLVRRQRAAEVGDAVALAGGAVAVRGAGHADRAGGRAGRAAAVRAGLDAVRDAVRAGGARVGLALLARAVAGLQAVEAVEARRAGAAAAVDVRLRLVLEAVGAADADRRAGGRVADAALAVGVGRALLGECARQADADALRAAAVDVRLHLALGRVGAGVGRREFAALVGAAVALAGRAVAVGAAVLADDALAAQRAAAVHVGLRGHGVLDAVGAGGADEGLELMAFSSKFSIPYKTAASRKKCELHKSKCSSWESTMLSTRRAREPTQATGCRTWRRPSSARSTS